MTHNVFGFLILLIVGLTCVLLSGIVLVRWFGVDWGLLGGIPGLIVLLPFTRLFDDKFKQLKATESEVPTDTAFCAECNQVFNVQDMIAHRGLHVCARCKPVFLQKLAEGAKIGSVPSVEPGRTRLLSLWFWLLLVIVALAAIILALLLPVTSHAPM